MVVLISKTELLNMSSDERKQWIGTNKHQLAGSAVFVKGKSVISKMISWVCKGKSHNKEFVPSHVGSLVMMGGTIYKFDMIPPKAKLVNLADYIVNTKDDFLILIRNFDLDTEKFSLYICEKINNHYGYLSALQSAFKFLWYPFREHCSEVHLKALQKQNLFTELKANNITPDKLYSVLKDYQGTEK